MRRIVPAESELDWGLLIKSWATGRNYLKERIPGDSIPLPHTYDEFVTLCNETLDLGLRLPDWMNAIVFVQPSKSALTIRLPPKEIVDENEAAFGVPGSTYEIPHFYDRFFGSTLNLPDIKEKKFEFHALRIGDYSISMCA